VCGSCESNCRLVSLLSCSQMPIRSSTYACRLLFGTGYLKPESPGSNTQCQTAICRRRWRTWEQDNREAKRQLGAKRAERAKRTSAGESLPGWPLVQPKHQPLLLLLPLLLPLPLVLPLPLLLVLLPLLLLPLLLLLLLLLTSKISSASLRCAAAFSLRSGMATGTRSTSASGPTITIR